MLKQIQQLRHLYRKRIRQTQINQYKRQKRNYLLSHLNSYDSTHYIDDNSHFNTSKERIQYASIKSQKASDLPTAVNEENLNQNEANQSKNVNIKDNAMRINLGDISQLIIRLGQSQNDQFNQQLWSYWSNEIRKIILLKSTVGNESIEIMMQVVDLTKKYWDEDTYLEALVKFNSHQQLSFLLYFLQSSHLITCGSFPNIFNMIETSLSSSLDDKIDIAVSILLKIIQKYQKKDMFQLHNNFPLIPKQLLNILADRINNKRQYINISQIFIYLLNNFDQIILYYSQSKLIHLCASIIQKGQDHHICCALDILKIFSACQHPLVRYNLIIDEENIDSKSWLQTSIKKKPHLHHNKALRISYIKLLSSVLVGATGQQLRLFCNKFMTADDESNILGMLSQTFLLNQRDSDIKYYIMLMINRFLFSQPEMNDRYLPNIFSQLQRHGLILIVYNLENDSSQRIRQVVGCIIEKIQKIDFVIAL